MTTPSQRPPSATLRVSVVIPGCGRSALLARSLDALERQNLPSHFYEIIVVDDGPHPATRELLAKRRALGNGRGPRLTYLASQSVRGPSAARNRGWQLARAPVIAFTDNDTVPAPNWLEQGLHAFEDRFDALCGRIEYATQASAPTERDADDDAERDADDDAERDADLDAAPAPGAELATANCFFRKSVLVALDGFDERFRCGWRADSDLHFRLLKMRANIASAPRARVVRAPQPAPWGASLFQLRKFSSDALLYKKHPELYLQRIRRLPRWDYYPVVATLLLALAGLASAQDALALGAGAVWLMLTALLCIKRLRGRRKSASRVLEIMLTSVLIPPLAVFWRLVGAIKFHVRFA
jgi:GT2 family glycosyltransferase